MKTQATSTATSLSTGKQWRLKKVEQRRIRSRGLQRKPELRRDQSPAEKDGVAAVDRALTILGAFRPGDTSLSTFEIAQRCNLAERSTRRIAQSLLRFGYLRCLEDESYQIGPAPLMLGAVYRHTASLGDLLIPLMREVADQTGESMSIYVRSGDVRVCLHRIDSMHAVRGNVREGDVLPLERGSGGRILLAFSGAKGKLYETIRTEYCYASIGERDPETVGISVPFFGAGHVMGAMTVAGPRSRIDKTFIANARALLLRAAARATSSLGGDASAINQSLGAILAGARYSTAAAARSA